MLTANVIAIDRGSQFDEAILKEQLDAFGQFLLVDIGLSKSTINNMRKLVRKALVLWKTISPSQAQIRAYIASLHNGYSFFHIANNCLALERYTEFLGDKMKLGRPRKPKRNPKETLTEAEIAVIIAAAKTVRERAMLTVLAYSGIRCEELCNLKVRDIDVASGLLQVIQGKGSKDRSVPIAGSCVKVVLEYLAKFPRDEGSFLFTTLRSNSRYSEWALRRMVKRVVKRTGIKKCVHPHLFRHSLATNMLMRGAHIITIQQLLGHSDIQTTMIYLSPKTTRLITADLVCLSVVDHQQRHRILGATKKRIATPCG